MVKIGSTFSLSPWRVASEWTPLGVWVALGILIDEQNREPEKPKEPDVTHMIPIHKTTPEKGLN